MTVIFCLPGLVSFAQNDFKADTVYINTLLKNGYEIARKNPDSARSLFTKEIALSTEINFTKGIVSGYEKAGYSYWVTGNYDEARNQYLTALSVSTNRHYDSLLGGVYLLIGATFSAQDDYKNSVPYYLKSIDFSESRIKEGEWADTINNMHFKNLVNCYNNLSDVFGRMNQFDKSLLYLRKGEKIARAKKSYENLAVILNNMSMVLLAMDSLQAAENSAMAALEISKKHNIETTLQYTYCDLGDIYEKKNAPAKAIQYYEDALLRSNTMGGKINTEIALGKLYAHQRQYQLAENILLTAQEQAKEHKTFKQLGNIYTCLAEIYQAQKNYRDACSVLSDHLILNDSFAVAERQNNVNLLETKFRTAEKDKSIAENNLLIARQKARINEKNIYIVVIVAAAVLVILFFFFAYLHRQRLQAEKIKALKDGEKIKMLLSVVQGEEKERSRLAGELHDGIGGLLSTVKMFFCNLQKKETSVAAYPDFNDAMNLLDETITEVRKTAHNLMPELLFNYGLPEAARLFCDTFQKANNIKINFQYYGFIGRLRRGFELFIYRILQELLQNISKHAKATEALVQISLHDNILSITIEDNGVGIKDTRSGNEGMGLQIIKSRVNDFAGQFVVQSGGKGTSIYIEIDIKNQDKFAA